MPGCPAAELRGPGKRPPYRFRADDVEADIDQRFGGPPTGRIILLGDGTEMMADTDHVESKFFHLDDEESDLESQVVRGGHPQAEPGLAQPSSSPGQPPIRPEMLNSTAVPEKIFTPPTSKGTRGGGPSMTESVLTTTDQPPEQSPQPMFELK